MPFTWTFEQGLFWATVVLAAATIATAVIGTYHAKHLASLAEKTKAIAEAASTNARAAMLATSLVYRPTLQVADIALLALPDQPRARQILCHFKNIGPVNADVEFFRFFHCFGTDPVAPAAHEFPAPNETTENGGRLSPGAVRRCQHAHAFPDAQTAPAGMWLFLEVRYKGGIDDAHMLRSTYRIHPSEPGHDHALEISQLHGWDCNT